MLSAPVLQGKPNFQACNWLNDQIVNGKDPFPGIESKQILSTEKEPYFLTFQVVFIGMLGVSSSQCDDGHCLLFHNVLLLENDWKQTMNFRYFDPSIRPQAFIPRATSR